MNVAAYDNLFQAPPVSMNGDATGLSTGSAAPPGGTDLLSLLNGSQQQSETSRSESFEALLRAGDDDSGPDGRLLETDPAIGTLLSTPTAAEMASYLRGRVAGTHAGAESARPSTASAATPLVSERFAQSDRVHAASPSSVGAGPTAPPAVSSEDSPLTSVDVESNKGTSKLPVQPPVPTVELPSLPMTARSAPASVTNAQVHSLMQVASSSVSRDLDVEPVLSSKTHILPLTESAPRPAANIITNPLPDAPATHAAIMKPVVAASAESPNSQTATATIIDASTNVQDDDFEMPKPTGGTNAEKMKTQSQLLSDRPIDSARPQAPTRTEVPVIDDDLRNAQRAGVNDAKTVSDVTASTAETRTPHGSTRSRTRTATAAATRTSVSAQSSMNTYAAQLESEGTTNIAARPSLTTVTSHPAMPAEQQLPTITDGENGTATITRTNMIPSMPTIDPMRVAGSEAAETVRPIPRFALETPRPVAVPGQITVRVTPPQLGPLRIDLRSGAQGIIGRLRFESAEARVLVEQDLPELRRTLAEAGIRLERLEIAGPLPARDSQQTAGSYQNNEHSLTEREMHERAGQNTPGQQRRSAEQEEAARRQPEGARSEARFASGALLPGTVNLVA